MKSSSSGTAPMAARSSSRPSKSRLGSMASAMYMIMSRSLMPTAAAVCRAMAWTTSADRSGYARTSSAAAVGPCSRRGIVSSTYGSTSTPSARARSRISSSPYSLSQSCSRPAKRALRTSTPYVSANDAAVFDTPRACSNRLGFNRFFRSRSRASKNASESTSSLIARLLRDGDRLGTGLALEYSRARPASSNNGSTSPPLRVGADRWTRWPAPSPRGSRWRSCRARR